MKRPALQNTAGGHRPIPPYPPIDPALFYPWAGWEIGVSRPRCCRVAKGRPALSAIRQAEVFQRGRAD